jgi:hypothetical protein
MCVCVCVTREPSTAGMNVYTSPLQFFFFNFWAVVPSAINLRGRDPMSGVLL